MKILSVANQKGGVGKTTTAINLSAALCHFGRKVLLIDMDPQGNAGRGLGIDINRVTPTIYEVLMGEARLEEAMVTTIFDGLKVVPSNLRLASLEASLYSNPTERPIFKLLDEALSKMAMDFDYVIIDCPPSLGVLNLNALSASSGVLIPVQCEYFAMEAVAAMLSSISNVQSSLNGKLKIEGFLLTMYDARTQLGTEISAEVRRLFKENTFGTMIPRNQSVSESQARCLPVTSFRPTSQGAQAYFGLAREIIDHEEIR